MTNPNRNHWASRRPIAITTIVAVCAALSAAATLAGCAASASTSTESAVLASAATRAPTEARNSVGHRRFTDPVSSHRIVQRAHQTPMVAEPGIPGPRPATGPSGHHILVGGSGATDVPPPAAAPLNPCRLVDRARARAILGGELVAEREAPLGPTCLFETRHPAQDITMTIELALFHRTVHELHRAASVAIGGFHAACGTLGRQVLYVSLGEERVLTIDAPCEVAKELAVSALTYLHGWPG
ncbi:MAG: hypothetical protein ACLP50_37430 [Solirubrobacteraceae bacterium]